MQLGHWVAPDRHLLALDALALSLRPATERLLIEEQCRELSRHAGVVPYPYQLQTCRRVIEQMRGRAILADEVGLGKTIEAGMILKEYMLRGLVRRALVLAPASLTWQWQLELREKFGIPAVRQRSRARLGTMQRTGGVAGHGETAAPPGHRARTGLRFTHRR